MNLGQIRAYARNLLNEQPGSSTFWTDGELNDYINSGNAELMQDLSVRNNATGTIANGANTIPLPADWVETETITAVPVSGGVARPLTQTTIRELEIVGADLTTTGLPSAYFYTSDGGGNQIIQVYPTADQAYTYRFYYFVTAVTLLEATVPNFDTRYHHILAYFCLKEAWAKGGRRPDLADGWERRWDKARIKAATDLVAKRNGDYIIRPVESFSDATIARKNDPLSWP